jgi:hypothetical protein
MAGYQQQIISVGNRRVIRVFPTLAAAAISGTTGDVLINSAEIPNAVLTSGGCSVLRTVYVVDYDDIQTSEDHTIIFHQTNAADFGTLDATAEIDDADLKLNKVLGFKQYDADQASTLAIVDKAKINELENSSGGFNLLPPIFLQAEENSTSVYFSVIQKVASGATPDWDTGDLEFIFHIEY